MNTNPTGPDPGRSKFLCGIILLLPSHMLRTTHAPTSGLPTPFIRKRSKGPAWILVATWILPLLDLYSTVLELQPPLLCIAPCTISTCYLRHNFCTGTGLIISRWLTPCTAPLRQLIILCAPTRTSLWAPASIPTIHLSLSSTSSPADISSFPARAVGGSSGRKVQRAARGPTQRKAKQERNQNPTPSGTGTGSSLLIVLCTGPLTLTVIIILCASTQRALATAILSPPVELPLPRIFGRRGEAREGGKGREAWRGGAREVVYFNSFVDTIRC